MYQLVAVVCSDKSLIMVNFSNSERVDMVMLYGDGNTRLARELWIERFTNRATH